MPATRANLIIEQGCDLDLVVTCTDDDGTGQTVPADLDGWTGRMQARERVDSETAVIDTDATVTCAGATVTIHIDADDTAGYEWSSAQYAVVITGGTQTRQVLRGTVAVEPTLIADPAT